MSSTASPYYVEWRILLGLLFAALAIETVALVVRRGRGYAPLDLASTFTSWGVMELSRFATFGARFAIFSFVSSLRPVSIPSGLVAFAFTYLAVDATYYARHRLLHATEAGWALHEPHHSTTDLTLLAALRLGWVQRLIDDFFYLPILLVGVDPLLLLVTIELNHGYQLWCHTTCIGRIPWLDGWLNTPSNHRVHHAADRAVCDSNFGSTFMVWDRLFGTYRAEPDEGIGRFGLASIDRGLSPLAYQLGPIGDWFASLVATKTRPSAATAMPSGLSNGDEA